MKLKTYKALALTFSLIALTGCEKVEDKERKPDLIDVITSNSIDVCLPSTAESEKDLKKLLNRFYSSKLDIIIEKGVNICLDIDLANVDYSFFQSVKKSIYYSEDNTLSLAHNGKRFLSDTKEILSRFTKVIERNPERLEENGISYGYSYDDDCGKGCSTTEARFKKLSTTKGFLVKNPEFLNAPLKSSRHAIPKTL